MLDTLRQKEAACAAVWITLGGINLTLLFTGAVFPHGRPITLSVIMTAVNALTLLLSGACVRVVTVARTTVCIMQHALLNSVWERHRLDWHIAAMDRRTCNKHAPPLFARSLLRTRIHAIIADSIVIDSQACDRDVSKSETSSLRFRLHMP